MDGAGEFSAKETSAGLRSTWVGMAVNLLLVGLKLSVGLAARSQALVADGVHSVSDLFSDVVVILGLKWGRKAEDKDHHFGHARIETISSMIVGFLLMIVAVGLAYGAIQSIAAPKAKTPGWEALAVAAASILLKELLYWYTRAVGKRLRSPALMANAWHHRSDAFSSVAVLLGLAAVYVNPNWHSADAYAALVVTLFVGKVGYGFVKSAFGELADTAPDPETVVSIEKVAYAVEGVLEVHDLRARSSGSQIFVEVHIVVDPDQTVREGHAIAATVKANLLCEIPDLTRVIVHVDPEPKAGQ